MLELGIDGLGNLQTCIVFLIANAVTWFKIQKYQGFPGTHLPTSTAGPWVPLVSQHILTDLPGTLINHKFAYLSRFTWMVASSTHSLHLAGFHVHVQGDFPFGTYGTSSFFMDIQAFPSSFQQCFSSVIYPDVSQPFSRQGTHTEASDPKGLLHTQPLTTVPSAPKPEGISILAHPRVEHVWIYRLWRWVSQ